MDVLPEDDPLAVALVDAVRSGELPALPRTFYAH